MWLWAQTANQNLKQNAQTQDADGMQAFFFVLYVTQLYLNENATNKGGSVPLSRHVSAEAPTTQHAVLKNKNS